MISKRYFPPELLYDFLKIENDQINSKILGYSVNGLPVYKLRIGNGKQNIFMWSQMHGNETTTTKAILDLIPWLLDPLRNDTLNLFTFHIIPQLNPDGAKAYTRLNANQFDLKRDSIKLSQPESKVLRVEYDRIKPDYALNLHGQEQFMEQVSMVDQLLSLFCLLQPILNVRLLLQEELLCLL